MYSLESVFGNQLGDPQNGAVVKACRICGALVVRHETHVNWHNEMMVR